MTQKLRYSVRKTANYAGNTRYLRNPSVRWVLAGYYYYSAVIVTDRFNVFSFYSNDLEVL